MTAEGERDAADLEVTRLEGELLTAEGDVTRLEGELLTAEGERDAADLEVTRLEGELLTAEGERDAADLEVTRLEGEVTRLEGELDAILNPVDDDPEGTAAADSKRTQIEAEADPAATDAGLGGSDAPASGATGAYTLAIAHGSTSITVEGATDDDDEEFMQAMDFGDGRTMLVREMDPDMMTGDIVREISIVATDIEAPVAVPFAEFEAGDESTPQMLNFLHQHGKRRHRPDV